MSEEFKPIFTDEDITATEVVEPVNKISPKTRKIITWSALIIVLIRVIAQFVLPFFQSSSTVTFLTIALLILGDLALIGLAAGFFQFYKEEKNRYLLYSSILVLLGGITNILGYIIVGLAEAQIILTSETDTLVINILSIISLVSLLAAFVFMKQTLDGFRREKRNIFKGQLSLVIGYILQIVYVVMYMIVPIDTITYIDSEGFPAILEEYKVFNNIAIYIGLATFVFLVWGFWYLRRAYVILDKLPEGFFERQEAQRSAMTQQRAQRGQKPQKPAQSMLGLGRQRPILPTERKEDEIDYKHTIIPPTEFKGKKMFCVKCGLELEHDAVYCSNCGETNPYIKR